MQNVKQVLQIDTRRTLKNTCYIAKLYNSIAVFHINSLGVYLLKKNKCFCKSN